MKTNVSLTKRETQVAELLAWGAAKKEAADQLHISTRTVENIARNIYEKVDIQKATELCVWWFCTHCGVSFDLSPVKRKLISIALLLIFIPQLMYIDSNTQLFNRRARIYARQQRLCRKENDNANANTI
jgi:DNA-binding CsgD family transcriptional regulator